ncbi:MAG: AraC family transcriptional regulator [Myxococcales bacterium]
MGARTIYQSPSLRVDDYRCGAAPGDPSFPEQHHTHCLAFVRRGSFGYRVRGKPHQLVAGALLVGRKGDEFVCTHDHHCGGDECLSLHLSEELADQVGQRLSVFEVGCAPPLPELMVLGELAQAAAEGSSSLAVEEAGMFLAARFAQLVSDRPAKSCRGTSVDRRRAVDAALWLDQHAHEEVGLEDLAREAGLSSFHFLRMFSNALGVSPHQYLLRVRLRRAARHLAERELSVTEIAYAVGFSDLSNFVRTFGRAAGMTPSAFRERAWGKRVGTQTKPSSGSRTHS